MLEVLLRVEEARLGLAEGGLVLLVVAHHRPQALHLLHSLHCTVSHVNPVSLMHQLIILLFMEVGLSVLQSRMKSGDLSYLCSVTVDALSVLYTAAHGVRALSGVICVCFGVLCSA